MRTLFNQPNVDKSDLIKYPNGRIRDNDGSDNGTGVNEATKGDLHQFFEKLMRLYDITPNDLPDNEDNGFQLIDALRGVASKNDFIYPLSTNGTILSVDIKLSQMLTNEYIVCLASFDKNTETQIKGSGVATFTITYNGNFKANEYVRVIKTSVGVSIIRLSDALSIDAMVADAGFLKKASQAEENSGSVDSVATTPLVNKVTFTKRVNGDDSGDYLATDSQNGIYPKEHFSIVDGLSEVIKSKEVTVSSWAKDRKYTVPHGISSYTRILYVNIALECISAEGGYSVGDVTNAQPRGADQDGSNDYDYGISTKWNYSGNSNINLFTGDRIYIARGPGDASLNNDAFNINEAKWIVKIFIFYI